MCRNKYEDIPQESSEMLELFALLPVVHVLLLYVISDSAKRELLKKTMP